jgi:hypothetical protein
MVILVPTGIFFPSYEKNLTGNVCLFSINGACTNRTHLYIHVYKNKEGEENPVDGS